ncbi:macrophage mannose receptor 1-like [Physella acuta]|uniref:macrophage mannose receptor 1-like n=1 Tax=Physella acuta TaxID=109671 RepID=UPI0027DD11E3|nr:macrophage mannose receptor 1-like [Physella acuta]XP_059171037.1 macrophage mannose receptor 1-like [Physella acuta]
MLLFIALLLHVFSGFASSSYSEEPSMCSMLTYTGAYNGHKYFISNFYYINAQQALDVCSSCGMYLVEVNDKFEYNFVVNVSKSYKIYDLLLSGSDAIKQKTWVFPNNAPVIFFEWGSGDPSNGGGEDYLAISNRNGYKMHDMRDPPTTICRFLCERATNPDDPLDLVK